MKVATTILVFCVAALLSLGMVILYSSSMVQKGTSLIQMQLVWAFLGLTACVVAAALDYRILKRFWWVFFAFACVLLLAVFVPEIGLFRNGARRWIDLRFASFQPSEFAKLALIISLAWYGERYQRHMATFGKGLLMPGALAGFMLALIFIEPDRGTTMLLAAVCGVMLLVAGARWLYILPPLALGSAALVYSFMHDPMRSRRIYSWLHLEETRTEVGMQAYQAMIALGSGGWTGLGLGNGRQKLGFVPEHHTDFILSIIGEELGLIATSGVVLGFVLIIVCGIMIAWRARDTFGFLLATGITSLIGLQAIINIGVVTSAFPNKGLPLPFISYGGSSLLMMLVGVGLLLSIARKAPIEGDVRKEQTNRAPDAGENPFAA